jgi:DNA ligase (NAD+)
MIENTEKLVESLEKYNEAYRAGRPEITDAQYDDLVEQLRTVMPDHPFLHTVEPEVLEGKNRVRHDIPMLSTEKSYTKGDLGKFVSRVLREASEIGLSADQVEFKATPKLDGVAGKSDGHHIVSRGDGRNGYDITDILNKGVIPKNGFLAGLGEIVMLKSYYNEYLADLYDHPRNICQGIIASDNLNSDFKRALDAGAVHYVRYSELNPWTGDPSQLLQDFDSIKKGVTDHIDYHMDGIVVEVANKALKDHMGSTSHHNRWQMAAKEKGETAITPVQGVRWQVGRTGVHTPVLDLEPVYLSGAEIRKATAHHAGNIKNLGVGVGSKVEIIRAGEVIPKLEKVIEPAGTLEIPSECVDCGTPLVWEKDFLRCQNLNCSAQVERKFEHWFKTLNACDGFGPMTIQKVVDYGCRSLEEVYELTVDEFQEMGLGPQVSKNLFDALKISMRTKVEDWRFLAAFGIRQLGRGDSRNLLEHIPLEELVNVDDPRQIKNIKGFGDLSSKIIVAGLQAQREAIHYMMGLNFNLDRTELLSEKQEIDSPIAGKGIVFTGKMEQGSRDDMVEQARSLGANVQKGVTGKTDILVCGAKVGAKKTGQAEKLGVQVISEDDYLEMIGENQNYGMRM